MKNYLLAEYLAELNDFYWRRPEDRRRTVESLAAFLATVALIVVTGVVLWGLD